MLDMENMMAENQVLINYVRLVQNAQTALNNSKSQWAIDYWSEVIDKLIINIDKQKLN